MVEYIDDVTFLSTPSARRATPHPTKGQRLHPISIHALREEGDFLRWSPDCRDQNFYPRPPRGGRRPLTVVLLDSKEFLSTPSARRATRCQFSLWQAVPISIHALREEGDAIFSFFESCHNNFYPRPPRGGRPGVCCCAVKILQISIHALREEGDEDGPPW